MLSSGSKYPIRLVDSLGNEIIDQDSNVGLVTAEAKTISTLNEMRGVYPGHQTLASSLLITRRAVNLPRMK